MALLGPVIVGVAEHRFDPRDVLVDCLAAESQAIRFALSRDCLTIFQAGDDTSFDLGPGLSPPVWHLLTELMEGGSHGLAQDRRSQRHPRRQSRIAGWPFAPARRNQGTMRAC